MNRYWLTPAYEADFEVKVSDINGLYAQAPELAKLGQRIESTDEMTGVRPWNASIRICPCCLARWSVANLNISDTGHSLFCSILTLSLGDWLPAQDTVTEPTASGGATYARAINNCVAFGALFPDELLTEHQPNERVVLKNLYGAMEIYAYAVYELTR